MPPGRRRFQVSVEEEFVKNPELNKDDMDRLRGWALSQPHFPVVPDEMLVWFLQSCYFNLQKAQTCMECYLTIRSMTPNAFCNRDVTDPEFRKYVDAMNVTVLPKRDPNGNVIFYHGLRDFDPANYNQLYDSKFTYMVTDMMLFREGTIPGLTLIMDLKGAKMGHLTKVNLSVVRVGAKYVQEASPIRLKAIHVVNVVPWIDKLMAIVKPFIKKQVLDMLHFHKEGSTTIYDFIPRESLPCHLGGSLPSVETLTDETIKDLERWKEFFVEDEKLRIDESKRLKTKKKAVIVDEMPATFSKLEID